MVTWIHDLQLCLQVRELQRLLGFCYVTFKLLSFFSLLSPFVAPAGSTNSLCVCDCVCMCACADVCVLVCVCSSVCANVMLVPCTHLQTNKKQQPQMNKHTRTKSIVLFAFSWWTKNWTKMWKKLNKWTTTKCRCGQWMPKFDYTGSQFFSGVGEGGGVEGLFDWVVFFCCCCSLL